MSFEVWIILSVIVGLWGALVSVALSALRSAGEDDRLAVPMWSTLVEGRERSGGPAR